MANSIQTIAELESSLLSIQKKVEDKGFRARIYYNISRYIWSAINLYVSVDITSLDGKGESLSASGDLEAVSELDAKVTDYLAKVKEAE